MPQQYERVSPDTAESPTAARSWRLRPDDILTAARASDGLTAVARPQDEPPPAEICEAAQQMNLTRLDEQARCRIENCSIPHATQR
jgi:hypothetical protein